MLGKPPKWIEPVTDGLNTSLSQTMTIFQSEKIWENTIVMT
jgi:hypothetical protein